MKTKKTTKRTTTKAKARLISPLERIWSAKSPLHADSMSKPIEDLKNDAYFHLQALWIRSMNNQSALVALTDLIVSFSSAASASCMKNAQEDPAKRFKTLVQSFTGKEADLKNGLASEFCSKWLFMGAWIHAGGDGAPCHFPIPRAQEAVKNAVDQLLQTYGENWQDHHDLAPVFTPLRKDWKTMAKWEKRDLVRQTLKSAARTYNRQEVRAKKAKD